MLAACIYHDFIHSIHNFLSSLIQPLFSSPDARRLGRVDEDVVLLESLDVLLKLVHLADDGVHAGLLANSVKRHSVVSGLLELLVASLPLLLQGSNELLTFVFRHQELLAVTLVLLFNLHFTNQVVLVLDLVLDLGQVLGNGAVVLLLEVVLVLLGGQLGRSEDVLNSVGDDEILVGDEAVNWFFVPLGNGWLGLMAAFKFSD